MRYRHVTSGAVVDVRDDKPMGSEWERVDGKSSAKKSSSKADGKADSR